MRYLASISWDQMTPPTDSSRGRNCRTLSRWLAQSWVIMLGFLFMLLIIYKTLTQRQYAALRPAHSISAWNTDNGSYNDKTSRLWGQYSPYFRLPSDISANLPNTCHFTFAQVLSRHGARYPTSFKSWSYHILISRIKSEVRSFPGPYSFLKDYSYELGADQLTEFGETQMFQSGSAFYSRYLNLTASHLPFIRASGQDRVVKSAGRFAKGYHAANLADNPSTGSPTINVIIGEQDGSNNTLSIKTCPAFRAAPNNEVSVYAKATWAASFVPPIKDRLNGDLVGANLTIGETIELMDLCAFETVAEADWTTLSPFCDLFTLVEWSAYDYYQALDKYYGHGMGNPLAPTLGVGFVNELIARLTDSPVQDVTCTNHTLDSSNATFPLGAKLYADFSHDNDMEAISAALGLFNATVPLPLTAIQDAEHSHGFSASWTVPFAARLYVEKMRCANDGNEYVRVVMNGRVVPLQACSVDHFGRCNLEDFVQSLGFARGGGHWDRCLIG